MGGEQDTLSMHVKSHHPAPAPIQPQAHEPSTPHPLGPSISILHVPLASHATQLLGCRTTQPRVSCNAQTACLSNNQQRSQPALSHIIHTCSATTMSRPKSCMLLSGSLTSWRSSDIRSPPTQYSRMSHRWLVVSYLLCGFGFDFEGKQTEGASRQAEEAQFVYGCLSCATAHLHLRFIPAAKCRSGRTAYCCYRCRCQLSGTAVVVEAAAFSSTFLCPQQHGQRHSPVPGMPCVLCSCLCSAHTAHRQHSSHTANPPCIELEDVLVVQRMHGAHLRSKHKQ